MLIGALASRMDEDPIVADISSRKRILIVDDDPAVLDALSFALGDYYDTQTCRDGANPLALLYVYQPDLILLDLSVPHACGDEPVQRPVAKTAAMSQMSKRGKVGRVQA